MNNPELIEDYLIDVSIENRDFSPQVKDRNEGMKNVLSYLVFKSGDAAKGIESYQRPSL